MTSDGGIVSPVSPWLCQGDLFKQAPVIYYPDLSQDFVVQLRRGPALLINHDCALDKLNQGKASIERLSFVSIRKVSALPADRQQLIRADKLQPYEAHYLGELSEFGESYIVLSDPYHIPADYFGVEAQEFADVGGEKRSVITNHDSRFGTLSSESLTLFRTKWNAYWTRLVPDA